MIHITSKMLGKRTVSVNKQSFFLILGNTFELRFMQLTSREHKIFAKKINVPPVIGTSAEIGYWAHPHDGISHRFKCGICLHRNPCEFCVKSASHSICSSGFSNTNLEFHKVEENRWHVTHWHGFHVYSVWNQWTRCRWAPLNRANIRHNLPQKNENPRQKCGRKKSVACAVLMSYQNRNIFVYFIFWVCYVQIYFNLKRA